MPLVYFSRLGTTIQSSNVGIAGGTISSVVLGVLIQQGKLLFSTTKFCHPVNFEACTDLVRQRRTLSVISTPCPTVSIDSALTSGLAGAAISECSDDKLTLRHRRHLLSRKVVSNLCLETSLENGRKVGMKSSWQTENCTIYSYLIAARTLHTSYLWTELASRGLHRSSSCAIAGPAHGVRRDTCACKENSTNSSNSSKQKAPLGKTLKLASGSCYLPHPDKEETGGEDAHFICSEAQAIGLADGVGGWADHGVDAGQYSRELMSNSVAAISGEPKGSIDPARVLEKAYLSTKAKGSSTACIITLIDQKSADPRSGEWCNPDRNEWRHDLIQWSLVWRKCLERCKRRFSDWMRVLLRVRTAVQSGTIAVHRADRDIRTVPDHRESEPRSARAMAEAGTSNFPRGRCDGMDQPD